MTKARELLNEKQVGETYTLSSGVTVQVVPFPAGLWEKINRKALHDFPDPEPPKKEITVVDGTEEVDDLLDPDYVSAKAEAERQRSNLLGEAIIDLCIQVDLSQYEAKIKHLEKYDLEPYPEDNEEKRVRFLIDYALRTRGDYETVMVSATTQMTISDPEVAERLKSFQREMEGTTDNGNSPSGSVEVERVEVQ